MAYFKRGKVEELDTLWKKCREKFKEGLHLLIIELAMYDYSTTISRGEEFENFDYNGEGEDYYEEESVKLEEYFEEINPFISFFKTGIIEKINAYTSNGREFHRNDFKHFFTMETCPFILDEVPLYFFPFKLYDVYYSESSPIPYDFFGNLRPCYEACNVESTLERTVDNSKNDELLATIDDLLNENLIYWQHKERESKILGNFPSYTRNQRVDYFEKDLFGITIQDIGETHRSYIYCLCDKKTKEGLFAFSILCPRKYIYYQRANGTTEFYDNGTSYDEGTCSDCGMDYKYVLSFSDDGSFKKWINCDKVETDCSWAFWGYYM